MDWLASLERVPLTDAASLSDRGEWEDRANLRLDVQGLIQKLPEPSQTAFRKLWTDHATLDETAQEMGLSRRTVSRLLESALDRLETGLIQAGYHL